MSSSIRKIAEDDEFNNAEIRKERKEHQAMLKEYHMVESIIESDFDNLSISWDYVVTDTPDMGFPVLLFTPNMNNTDEHYHIELRTQEALKLRNWLNKFLELKGIK
jgi:hypothetical protein